MAPWNILRANYLMLRICFPSSLIIQSSNLLLFVITLVKVSFMNIPCGFLSIFALLWNYHSKKIYGATIKSTEKLVSSSTPVSWSFAFSVLKLIAVDTLAKSVNYWVRPIFESFILNCCERKLHSDYLHLNFEEFNLESTGIISSRLYRNSTAIKGGCSILMYEILGSIFQLYISLQYLKSIIEQKLFLFYWVALCLLCIIKFIFILKLKNLKKKAQDIEDFRARELTEIFENFFLTKVTETDESTRLEKYFVPVSLLKFTTLSSIIRFSGKFLITILNIVLLIASPKAVENLGTYLYNCNAVSSSINSLLHKILELESNRIEASDMIDSTKKVKKDRQSPQDLRNFKNRRIDFQATEKTDDSNVLDSSTDSLANCEVSQSKTLLTIDRSSSLTRTQINQRIACSKIVCSGDCKNYVSRPFSTICQIEKDYIKNLKKSLASGLYSRISDLENALESEIISNSLYNRESSDQNKENLTNRRDCFKIGRSPIQAPADSFQFGNLSIFIGSELILSNLNFHIKEGDKIALVGKNGSGKTTLLRFLLGFYASEGSISENFISLSKNQLSYISQNSFLFGTIYKELMMYSESEESMMKACQLFKFETILSKLPDGLNTKIDKLSISECQMIEIIQTYLKKSKILLADELLSNLDENYEELVLSNMLDSPNHEIKIVSIHNNNLLEKFNRVFYLYEDYPIAKNELE